MARDTEQLVLQLSADLRAFQNQMLRAAGEADRAAQRVERRFQQMNKKLVSDFQNFSNAVSTALATIGVGVVARDVVLLGDVWTRVGNRLAFAGVEASKLAATQQVVADIASRTRSELESTADLFARMYRSSEDLGASMADVAAVTEIVSKALAGASQAERASAIRQLGQGLGSGRLQGDELRSILENSRPIAEAIAKEFETTVGNLRILGKQGELESRRVFQAILSAGADIEAAYSQTTFTVADSFQRLRTEAARFIGTNEQTSASTRALTRFINEVTDNFDLLASAVIVAATAIGGALAGQAIARAITALAGMSAGMATAAGRASALKGALAFFGGPLGALLTAAGVGMAYLATQTDVFASNAERIQRAEDSLYSALQVIASLEEATVTLANSAGKAADTTDELADAAAAANEQLNDMTDEAGNASEAMSVQERASRDLAVAERERALATIQAAIADREALIASEQRARSTRALANALGVLGDPEEQRQRVAINRELDAEGRRQIEAHERRIEFLSGVLERLERGTLTLPQQSSGDTEDSDPTGGDRASRQRTLADLERQAELTLARLRHQEATVRELEDAAALEQRIAAYVDAGLALADARVQAETEVRAERAAMNEEAQRSYELSQLQDQADLARLENNYALADVLADELEIRRRTRDIVQQLAVSEADALKMATEFVAAMREAREIEREHELDMRELSDQLDAARARGDRRTEAAIERRLELEQRIADLRRLGVTEEVAASRANAELQALEDANAQGAFRRWFSGGVMAALDGDLDDFFENWIRERAAAGLEAALNEVADVIFDAFRGILTQVIQNGQDGLGQAVAAIFTGGMRTGVKDLGEGAASAARVLDKVFSAAAADAATKIAVQGATAAATAAKEGAAAAAKQTSSLQLIAAEGALARAALAAASALSQVAAAGGSSGSLGALGNIFGAILGGFSGGSSAGKIFAGFRAGGGPMDAFKAYMVGERGPEMVVPNVPSFVIPNGALGGRSVIINDNTVVNIQGASTAEMAQLRAQMQGDLATRRQQIIAVMDDAFGRRQVLQG